MIVRQFISWIRTASAGERAEATRALARAWLISDLSADDRAAAELELIENAHAELAPFSWDRIVERHGHLSAIRESMLVLEDLPAATRAALVAKLSETLAQFVVARNWLSADRAGRVTGEARDRSAINIAARSQGEDI